MIMHFFVVITNECNLNCKYCKGKECREIFTDLDIDYSLPSKMNYSAKELKKFIERDESAIVNEELIF